MRLIGSFVLQNSTAPSGMKCGARQPMGRGRLSRHSRTGHRFRESEVQDHREGIVCAERHTCHIDEGIDHRVESVPTPDSDDLTGQTAANFIAAIVICSCLFALQARKQRCKCRRQAAASPK